MSQRDRHGSAAVTRLLVVLVGLAVVSSVSRDLAWGQSAIRPPTSPAVRFVAARLQAEPAGEDSEESLFIASELTNPEAVAGALERVKNDATLSDEERERLTKPLTQAIKYWRQRKADAEKAAASEKSLSTVGRDTERARPEAERQPDPIPPPAQLQSKSFDQLREGRAAVDVQVEDAKKELEAIETEIAARQPRRVELPKQIADAKQQLENLQSQPVADAVDDSSGLVTEARKAEREAQMAALRQSVETWEKELKLIEGEAELLPLRRRIAEKKLNHAIALQQAWETAVRQSKQSRTRTQLKDYRKELNDPRRIDQSEILDREEDWMDLLRQTEQLGRRLTEEKSKTAELTRWLREKQSIIDKDLKTPSGIRSSLGMELQLLQSRLPQRSDLTREMNRVEEQIDQLQAEQTRLQMALEWGEGEITALALNGQPGASSVSQLPETEANLTKAYIDDLQVQIDRLVALHHELEEQLKELSKLRTLIDSHVMWIRNRPPFALTDLSSAWQALRQIVHPTVLRAVVVRAWRGFVSRLELLVLLVGCVLVLLFAGSRLRRRIQELAERAKSQSSTSLRPTWLAMIVTLALSIPLFVLLYVIGEAIQTGAANIVLLSGFASGFKLAAYAAFPAELLRQVLRPRGLAIAHFGADESTIKPLRSGLRVLIDLGVPLVILWRITQSLGKSQIESSLGRLLYLVGMVLIAVLLYQAMHPRTGLLSTYLQRRPEGWMSRLRAAWFPTLVALPMLLAGISMAGYQYASHALVERVHGTLWLGIAAYLVSGTLWRWLLTQRRRLALAVYREKLEDAQRTGVSGMEIEHPESMAAAEINAQTSRLFTATVLTVVLVGLAIEWSSVLPAVQFLEAFELWNVEDIDETGETVLRAVTLANIVKMLPVLILTWIAVRNLPGLVEGFLLERLPIDKAARYAITSLGTYLLAAAGILLSAKTLGLQWNSIQWLVAALGVGLGFGLQEIFANFVSGLILLFEQPIRVGDIVTLGDTTGVVSRIRIRATTITNWDRQELVVPNKDLITGRLINWTLSDSTNRIVVNVGVAYGSDTTLACEQLRQICEDHSNVLEDPAPLITFEGFGDSTLNLVLRCYLSSLDIRLMTIHELHTEINQRFAANGIEIAFPQRDLHIRSVAPELTLGYAGEGGEVRG